MTLPFGEEDDKFESSLFLVLSNRIITCCVAVFCLLVRSTTLSSWDVCVLRQACTLNGISFTVNTTLA